MYLFGIFVGFGWFSVGLFETRSYCAARDGLELQPQPQLLSSYHIHGSHSNAQTLETEPQILAGEAP